MHLSLDCLSEAVSPVRPNSSGCSSSSRISETLLMSSMLPLHWDMRRSWRQKKRSYYWQTAANRLHTDSLEASIQFNTSEITLILILDRYLLKLTKPCFRGVLVWAGGASAWPSMSSCRGSLSDCHLGDSCTPRDLPETEAQTQSETTGFNTLSYDKVNFQTSSLLILYLLNVFK